MLCYTYIVRLVKPTFTLWITKVGSGRHIAVPGCRNSSDEGFPWNFICTLCHCNSFQRRIGYFPTMIYSNNNEDLNCPHFSIEQVQQCKYLGTNINDTNSIDEEIKARIVLGTKAYYANLKFFKSRLVTKHPKLRLYRSVIRPIVTYAAETWVLTESSIQKLSVFERKILRKIFGPTRENQLWRIKTNNELNKLIKHKNIVNYIKALRLSWFGHVQRMPDFRRAKKIFKWMPLTTRPKGWPKQRWEDNVIQGIRLLNIKNWTACAQDRVKWKNVVEKAKTLKRES